jgi:hypothetical protein
VRVTVTVVFVQPDERLRSEAFSELSTASRHRSFTATHSRR